MTSKPEKIYNSSRRAVYSITVHLVFVTKYRRKILNEAMIRRLGEVFRSVAEKWDSQLIEFNGESDHVHLLLSYPPHKLLSNLIANLKATASKTLWREFETELAQTYGKRVLWTGSYFVASCGGVTIEQLKVYVQNQDCPDSSHH
ncbi:IS200/IS605 family transposase [Limnoraphis robusta Tam1]|uniref:IS200/IS605 family transposase n=1 Tax=Limnoraphis robusta CCNP1315 TaxID=3110306 RepID=A0ABU5U7R8_9CYAN|nr:IS200/IS605 family transposase [Limnoraphis robusta]MEA5501146.1 IS200/IS605 family transposase [Limnoraphis robusta BA-68 BA1]MEA5522163.1 IS200/IS605 family transposase [Limnoraphis robusta CCNP1315]MEA5542041.1 IS200/IS605 family transposase [Limnoraphis robusta Tam1]MEA5544273.1 IS200/IS605 family transposase [Limnoraphis robusta CCNP1324]